MNPAHNLKRVLLFYLVFLMGTVLSAQNKATELDKYFSALAKNGYFNGNVLVAEKGKVIYERSFGYADLSANKLNTAATSFHIASITKTFTSTAILQLQEKGKLAISDPYIKYFPSFPYPATTIRQLLSHTSGIPSSAFYRFLDSLRKTTRDTFFVNADVIPALVAMGKPLPGQPGDNGQYAFAYSNLNYYLLALLVEKLSGMPYAAYLKKNIFLPAGMNNTSLSEFSIALDNNICREHRRRYLYDDAVERVDTVAELAYIFTTYNLKGHGDMASTVGDLLKYDQALYNGTLLNPGSLAQAYHAIVPGVSGNSGYGLGWSIGPDSSKGKIVMHHGGGMGIEAMLVRNITKQQVITLFDNTRNPAFTIALNAFKILNGEKLPLPKKRIARSYGQTLVKHGIPAARILLEKSRKDSLHYTLDEDELNVMAYQMMRNNMDTQAFEIFRTIKELFPDSWNAYDSYGEILAKMGRKGEAVKMYQRSMELNPENESGKKALKELLKDDQD